MSDRLAHPWCRIPAERLARIAVERLVETAALGADIADAEYRVARELTLELEAVLIGLRCAEVLCDDGPCELARVLANREL